MDYHHRQTGWLLRLLVIAPAPLILALGAVPQPTGPAWIWFAWAGVVALALLVVVGFVFSTLTIEVDAQELRWFFGWGAWRKTIARGEIAGCAAVVNPWWYGFGIHRTPRGWLYNVAGLVAVVVQLKDGRTLRLGTDEPDALVKALSSRR